MLKMKCRLGTALKTSSHSHSKNATTPFPQLFCPEFFLFLPPVGTRKLPVVIIPEPFQPPDPRIFLFLPCLNNVGNKINNPVHFIFGSIVRGPLFRGSFQILLTQGM